MPTLAELPYRTAAPSPIARFESGVAVAGGKLYITGGHMAPELIVTPRTLVYDPDNDAWESRADAPLALSHVTAAVVDDRYIWLAGGYEGQHPGTGIAASHRYDVVEDRWNSGPPLPEVRASGGLAVVGRRLHFFGGLGADRATNFGDHWALDVDNPSQWEPRAPLPAPRTHASTAAVDGHIYAIGGHFGHDIPEQLGFLAPSPDLDLVHRYDPTADKWEQVAPLRRRRSHCETSTFTMDGKIVCIGGRNNSPDAVSKYDKVTLAFQAKRALKKVKRMVKPPEIIGLDDVIGYDPAADRWFDIGRVPDKLYAPAAAAIGDEVIVTNGGRKGWREPSDTTIRLTLPLE